MGREGEVADRIEDRKESVFERERLGGCLIDLRDSGIDTARLMTVPLRAVTGIVEDVIAVVSLSFPLSVSLELISSPSVIMLARLGTSFKTTKSKDCRRMREVRTWFCATSTDSAISLLDLLCSL